MQGPMAVRAEDAAGQYLPEDAAPGVSPPDHLRNPDVLLALGMVEVDHVRLSPQAAPIAREDRLEQVHPAPHLLAVGDGALPVLPDDFLAVA